MDLPVGTPVIVTTGRGSCFGPGTLGTIIPSDGSTLDDVYYRVERTEDERKQYIYRDDVTPGDITAITDLESWKRLAVKALYEAKQANDWCGEAEEVARLVGLGDYLPTDRTVEITVRIPVRQWSGESDAVAMRAAAERITIPGAAWIERRTII